MSLLWLQSSVLCTLMTYDLLFLTPKEEFIIELAEQLRAEEIELEDEGDADGFLGVQLCPDKATGHSH